MLCRNEPEQRYHRPEKGDPKHGIEPGARFEDLPDDWMCPRSKQPKEKFNKA